MDLPWVSLCLCTYIKFYCPTVSIYLQVDNDELGIGTATRLLVLDQEDDWSMEEERKFFRSVRFFYETTVRKIVAKFPFKDKTLADLKVINEIISSTV